MPATTARGTDAERTEDAAPVALVEVLEVVADAAALLVVDGKRVISDGWYTGLRSAVRGWKTLREDGWNHRWNACGCLSATYNRGEGL